MSPAKLQLEARVDSLRRLHLGPPFPIGEPVIRCPMDQVDDIHDDPSFRLGMIVGRMQAITDMMAATGGPLFWVSAVLSTLYQSRLHDLLMSIPLSRSVNSA